MAVTSPAVSAGTTRSRPDSELSPGFDTGLPRLEESAVRRERPEALDAIEQFMTDGDRDRPTESPMEDTAAEAARAMDSSSRR
jgi:hypothetical protein